MRALMLYQLAADLIIFLHFAFILFVLFGGLLVYKWRWLIWLHIPAAIWGAMTVIVGWVCPLTPLENWLRQASVGDIYSGSFLERYLTPVIYPSGLNKEMFIMMGVFVIVVNVIVYTILIVKNRNKGSAPLKL
jgi:hypothetical protein